MNKYKDKELFAEDVTSNLHSDVNNPSILPKKVFSKYKEPLLELPNLVENHLDSYKRLIEKEIGEVFQEFSPILDYSENKFSLEILSWSLSKPEETEVFIKDNKKTLEAPLKIKVRLTNKSLGTKKEQEIFLSDFPHMTEHGTFIVNGIERVVVPQLSRASGVFFDSDFSRGVKYFSAKVIPNRGAWIEFLSEIDNQISVRIDKKRKVSLIAFLRAFGFKDDKEILSVLPSDIAKNILSRLMESSHFKNRDLSAIEIYKKLKDGDTTTAENAIEYIESIFSKERYDLSEIGRLRFNKRFDLDISKKALSNRSLNKSDIGLIIDNLIKLNNDPDSKPDDIDHLSSRRVRFVGEMMLSQIRKGMLQMKRNIQDKMSVIDSDVTLPASVINPRPFQARIKEFFTINQLSQFMNQENILSELENLRTISALGPGGLNRERAGFEVRDVHTSHYGRICPIHTPDGANIGLILRLANYSKINEYGIIETPYVKVKNGKVTDETHYLNALEEENVVIASSETRYNDKGMITQDRVVARRAGVPEFVKSEEVDYMDVSSNQAYSLATSMIPFLEHDDAARAMFGSNMQKQAVPLVIPEAPYVATGIEDVAAKSIGRLIYAKEKGEVTYVDAKKIIIKDDKGKTEYHLINFAKTNVFNYFHHRPIVNIGDKVKEGDLLADVPTSQNGQIALGQNVLVAFMPWNGYNYEDAIVISERLIEKSKFTSIHIEEFICSVRDTKIGEETTTHDIPNVSEYRLKNLDEEGIVRLGSEVEPGDILVGKITPKGETELSPEERLLRSIFGEKVRDVKDTSLRVDNGQRGRVINIKVFSREKGDSLETGVIKRIHIEVAQIRNISVGDKLSGRHGNKGIISKVLPVEDMPYTADGTPIDIILTPLGVPSRMNLGQILEMHLGYAAKAQGYQAICPIFQGATVEEISNELTKIGMSDDGRVTLYNGSTGEPFQDKIAIGYKYMLKLHHMVEDKIHQRSVGPYSLITQQPLGGRAQNGGQRFGEMEVWALEGYGAAHVLREMLTIKSDDIEGRAKAYDAIIKSEPIKIANTPASFNVLLNTLRGLGLNPIPINNMQKGNDSMKEYDSNDDIEKKSSKSHKKNNIIK